MRRHGTRLPKSRQGQRPGKATAGPNYRTSRLRLYALKVMPENIELYGEVDTRSESFRELLGSITKKGLLEPLIVTRDHFIVSGHRRYEVLKMKGQLMVPCRLMDVYYAELTKSRRIALLREHNRYRHKTAVQQVKESLVDLDPGSAAMQLEDEEERSLTLLETNGVVSVEIGKAKERYEISDEKKPHVKHIHKVFEKYADHLPINNRKVHYGLLDYKFIRGYDWPHRYLRRKKSDPPGSPRIANPLFGKKQTLYYANDDESYRATCDLLVRLRLNGEIPWEWLDDFTRPFEELWAFDNVEEFIRHEIEYFLVGYRRRLLQSQRNHYEVLVEKNTVLGMAQKVATRYGVEIGSARGFNSIDAYYDLVKRFKKSKKEKLILVMLTDYDPEGQRMLHTAGHVLCRDFNLMRCEFRIVPAGLTKEQAEGLPQQCFAKEYSSSYDWFVDLNDGDKSVWELEAMPPDELLAELEKVLQGVIDMPLLQIEKDREKEELKLIENIKPRLVEWLLANLT